MLPPVLFGSAAVVFTALLAFTWYHARAIGKSKDFGTREYHTRAHMRGGISLFAFGATIAIVLPLFLEKFLAQNTQNACRIPWLDWLHVATVIAFVVLCGILCLWLTGRTWKKHPRFGRICIVIGFILELEGLTLYIRYFR